MSPPALRSAILTWPTVATSMMAGAQAYSLPMKQPFAPLSRRSLLARGTLALGSAALPAIGARAQAIGPVMATLSTYMAAAKDR